jgi:phosphopantothenoylcysteine decarboxylase/phosphopantothenate--cysteine ligase
MSNPFANKHIVLGVTGSVAAYKAVELASKLTQSGALVDVVLTEGALHFVSALQFQSVTGRKAFTDADLWGGEAHVVHVNLGHSADLLVIAPATASTMAKLANGLGDNLLSVSALAAHCPLVLARRWTGNVRPPGHPGKCGQAKRTRRHFHWSCRRSPGIGAHRPGRFEEPANIVAQLRYLLSREGALKGKRVIVTAGGTEEPIDPVRVITNRSSGSRVRGCPGSARCRCRCYPHHSARAFASTGWLGCDKRTNGRGNVESRPL